MSTNIQIESIIKKNVNDLLQTTDIKGPGGVYFGKASVVFLLSNYYDYYKNQEILEKISDLISDLFNNISTEKSYSLSGLSGLGFVMILLLKKGLLDRSDVEPYLHELNNVIIESLEQDVSLGNYDLMHGYIGKLVYLTEYLKYVNNNTLILNKINESIHFFEDISTLDSRGNCFWKNNLKNNNKVCVGMAHGMPSIITFLANLYESNLIFSNQERIKRLIKSGTNWLINHRNIVNNEVSSYYFPFIPADNNERKSYLAWCYGDLGVTFAFLKAGKVLKNSQLYSYGIEIGVNSAKKRLYNAGITSDDKRFDTSLCHGSFGIFFQFDLLFQETSNEIFKEAALYWLKLNLNSAKPNYYFNDYKVGSGLENNIKWEYDTSLLNGISGISLVLLSTIKKQRIPDLEKILLLNL